MLIRKRYHNENPSSEDWGHSSIDVLLKQFEKRLPSSELVGDLRTLNREMVYEGPSKRINLYQRLKEGRDQLIHGNVLRTNEVEGQLLVLLIDLIALHTMKAQLRHAPLR